MLLCFVISRQRRMYRNGVSVLDLSARDAGGLAASGDGLGVLRHGRAVRNAVRRLRGKEKIPLS